MIFTEAVKHKALDCSKKLGYVTVSTFVVAFQPNEIMYFPRCRPHLTKAYPLTYLRTLQWCLDHRIRGRYRPELTDDWKSV